MATIQVEIKIDQVQINGNSEYNFTYEPSTFHMTVNDNVQFAVAANSPIQPAPAWVVLDRPVKVASLFSVKLGGENPMAVGGFKQGIHHYQFVGIYKGDLVADTQCPSVIVH